jgi:protein phosphatase
MSEGGLASPGRPLSNLGDHSSRPGMKITYQAITDVGRKRKGNEDSLFVNADQHLFVVADGMGGHAAGEIASRVAVDSINEFVCLTGGDEEITWPFGLDESISYDGNRLKTAIRFANRKVLEVMKEKAEYEGMATTVAAVLVDGDTANLGHVGDSRVYLARGGEVKQLTSDHSWVNEQIQTGVLSADQARSHPLRNVVTRALGGKPDLQVDMQALKLEKGDLLLLCSDGLTTMLTDDEIAGILGEDGTDVEKAARALVAAANNKGGEDNITVLLLRFDE